VRLPWIPDEADWRAILEAARHEPIRNRSMLALGYDAGLRCEELCSLRTDDLDAVMGPSTEGLPGLGGCSSQ